MQIPVAVPGAAFGLQHAADGIVVVVGNRASCLAHKAPEALEQPAKLIFLPYEAGIRPFVDSCRQSL